MYPKNYTVYVDTEEDLRRLGGVLDDLGLDVDVTSGEVTLSLDPKNPFSYVSFQIGNWS
jgi:hypothetical protein